MEGNEKMRRNLLMAGVFAAAVFAAPAVYAQDAGADTTCADFVKLDATAQADLVSKLGSTDSMSSDSNSGDEKGDLDSGEAAATSGSMDAAAVLAACQANPSLTVGAAMSGNAGAQ
jgi:hypothetical protein